MTFVAILGSPPPEPIAKEMLTALKMGEIAPMPDNVIAVLAKRSLDRKEELTETNKSYLEQYSHID